MMGIRAVVRRIVCGGYLVALIMAPVILPTGLHGNFAVTSRLLDAYDNSVPGTEYRGVITVHNTQDKPLAIKISQEDYGFKADGSVNFDPPGTKPRSNAKWISLDTARLELAPDETRQVNYTIKVPKDSALKGSYWSLVCLVPEEPVRPVTKGLTITPVFRYAIQIVNRFDKEHATASLKLLDMGVKVKETKPTLTISVENNGEMDLDPKLSLELLNSAGALVVRLEGGRERIYPGSSIAFDFDVSTVAKGTYLAVVVMDCGDENLFGVQREVTI